MHPLFRISNDRLGYNAQRASILNITARGIDFLFQATTMIVLARLLMPADFGVFAMATAFVWILMTVGDLGLASAVLQQRELNERQASAVFYINLLAGFAFGGLFLLSSPLLGWFYGDPQVTKVAAVLSIIFVFSSFTAVQQALLRRALWFDVLLRAQVAASAVASIMAVVLGLNGAGYWALAVRALIEPLIYAIVIWIAAGWRPTRAEKDDTVRSLLRFGLYSLGASLMYSVGRNANNVFIGWRHGSAELGPFVLATRLFFLPVQQISWPLGHVMVPILSRLREDTDTLKEWYLKLLRLLTFISFPPFFSLAICADDVINVIAGPQWSQAGDILKLLAPIGALQVGYATTDWLMRSQGQGDRLFRWTAIDTTTCLVGCILGLPWGATGVAAGLAVANLVLFFPSFVYAGKGRNIRLTDVLQAMIPAVLLTLLTLAAVSALTIYVAQDWHPSVRLLVSAAVIAAIMTCGIAFVYGRSVPVRNDRPHSSDPTLTSVFQSCRSNTAIRRIRQLLSHDTRDLVWLGYVVGIAPWLHRAATPMHRLRRWQVYHRRQHAVNDRMELLRARLGQGLMAQGSFHRVALAQLCPELDEICRPLRRPNEEIVLASIDQDGFFYPRFERFWAAPCVDAGAFLPRGRFELSVVDRDGWVGVRKDFRGNKTAFVSELETALDLAARGCNVPALLSADFEQLSITFAYINGSVVRELLAQAGAPMRDRDVRPSRFALASCRIQKERRAAGRRLVDQVLQPDTVANIGEALLAIHRAGYTFEDVKYGNVIIEATTNTPYFVDCERALPLGSFSRATATYLRDCDADKLNQLFGTKLLTANVLRRFRLPAGATIYSPFHADAGIWWGAIWNPDLGIMRWRHILAKNLPVPKGGRILDLGANNGFNALQMLRAGASEVIGVEIDPAAIEQGLFVKRVFEWADNAEYRFSYIRGSHTDVGAMDLGRFDLITAFCTLYYLSAAMMKKTVCDLAKLTDTLVLQCNNDLSIERRHPETYTKASLPFTVGLLRSNGFPNITVIERPGSNRPLVIARSK